MGRDVDGAIRRYFECSLGFRVDDLVRSLHALQAAATEAAPRLTPKEMDVILNRLEEARRVLAAGTPSVGQGGVGDQPGDG